MIEVRYTEGRFCPMLVCDHCGELVKRSGNMLWKADPDGTVTAGPFSVHKPCNRPFVAAHGGRAGWLWAELSTFLWQLVGNAEVDLDRGRQWHEALP
jgi:hypothetical protein